MEQHQCQKVILIRPDVRRRQKTDRRDATAMGAMLIIGLLAIFRIRFQTLSERKRAQIQRMAFGSPKIERRWQESFISDRQI